MELGAPDPGLPQPEIILAAPRVEACSCRRRYCFCRREGSGGQVRRWCGSLCLHYTLAAGWGPYYCYCCRMGGGRKVRGAVGSATSTTAAAGPGVEGTGPLLVLPGGGGGLGFGI